MKRGYKTQPASLIFLVISHITGCSAELCVGLDDFINRFEKIFFTCNLGKITGGKLIETFWIFQTKFGHPRNTSSFNLNMIYSCGLGNFAGFGKPRGGGGLMQGGVLKRAGFLL